MTSAAEDYPLPATVEGVRERIAELTGDIELILAQLRDTALIREKGNAYHAWRNTAQYALAHKKRERVFLEAQRARMIVEQNAANTAARAERLAAQSARMAQEAERRAAARASLGGESRLVADLYGACARLYRLSGLPVTERDRVTLDAAHDYLVQQGVFDD